MVCPFFSFSRLLSTMSGLGSSMLEGVMMGGWQQSGWSRDGLMRFQQQVISTPRALKHSGGVSEMLDRG